MTVIELIVTLIIFGGIAAVLFVSTMMGNRGYASSEASVHVQQEARRALDSMVREVRAAGGTIAAAGSQFDFQLALGYGAPCGAGAACWGARDQDGVAQEDWSLRYRLNGAQLVREILDETGAVQPGTRILANDVNQLTFTYVGADTNSVTIQLQTRQAYSNLAGGAVLSSPQVLSMRVRLRNPA